MTQRIGPGRVNGATIEVLVGDTWRRMEPIRTPLGDAILAYIDTDPEPCGVCGYYNCQCESPCDPHGELNLSEELPY